MQYIIYVGVFFMPDKNAASQRALAFSSIIRAMGYVPIIIGMDEQIPEGTDILNTKTFYKDCVYYLTKYPATSKEWVRMLYNISPIKRIVAHLGKENVKAVIAMDYFSCALLRLMFFCKKNSIKFVADTVDWFQKSNDPFPRNIVKDIDTNLRMKVMHKKVKYMITISKYLYQYYERFVPNIVQIPGIVRPLQNQSIMFSGIDKTVCTFAFVGSPGAKCEKEKIDWLIKIICKINQNEVKAKLYIAGIDKQTLFENRPDIAAIPNFEQSVMCYGRMKHKDCLRLLSSCDFATIIRKDSLLSRAGFPTKIGEAFACGTPVFVTPTSDVCDYIPPTHGIVANRCTKEATEEAMNVILRLSREEILDMHEAVAQFNPLENLHFKEQMQNIIM